ncbi:MAG: DUF2493 domain-containing protein [Actinomycetota bacterium]
MRVLVTGSRDWRAVDVLEAALEQATPSVVVHGACPSGADHLAHRWAVRHGIEVETHPARWDLHGKAAGFRRNAEMVGSGAHVVLAFLMPCTQVSPRCRGRLPHPSHGAAHTADLAASRGIRVVRHFDPDAWNGLRSQAPG